METQLATTTAGAGESGLNFYRPARRVTVLLLVAPVFYEFWWYWQLFRFTNREGFPRAQRFWWIFVPIYGWVVLHRQFSDLESASFTVEGPTFSAGTAVWLVIISWIVGNASARVDGAFTPLGLFVASGVLIAIMGSLVQPTANAYLRNAHPDAQPTGMTWGETTAAVLGIALFALVVLGLAIG